MDCILGGLPTEDEDMSGYKSHYLGQGGSFRGQMLKLVSSSELTSAAIQLSVNKLQVTPVAKKMTPGQKAKREESLRKKEAQDKEKKEKREALEKEKLAKKEALAREKEESLKKRQRKSIRKRWRKGPRR